MSNNVIELTGPEIPVSSLSIFDPIYLGIDEIGQHIYVDLVYRNILLGGEPGSGKSVALNEIVAHAALSNDVALWLMDGKQVELGLWAPIAEVFVGNNIIEALARLRQLQYEMDHRYDMLAAVKRRKIVASDGVDIIMLVIDEVAYYSATVGRKEEQDEFIRLLRDLVARGRAAGIIVVAATQRPSADIIATSLRDLFGYRAAFRCSTDSSSDIVLGQGWATEGYSAKTITPEDRGVGYLLTEGGVPRRIKTAYLSDADIYMLVERAAWARTTRRNAA